MFMNVFMHVHPILTLLVQIFGVGASVDAEILNPYWSQLTDADELKRCNTTRAIIIFHPPKDKALRSMLDFWVHTEGSFVPWSGNLHGHGRVLGKKHDFLITFCYGCDG